MLFNLRPPNYLVKLDLELTMESGQPPHFLWDHACGRHTRIINGEKAEIWMEKGRLRFTEGFGDYARELLRLDDDLDAICSKISTDRTMECAVESCAGLRITKSDPWETLVCFVCSINNNIPRIGKMVRSLMVDGEVMPPEEMAAKDLGGLRLGYRDKFLKGCAEKVIGYEFEKIGLMDYGEAWKELQTFPGVGPKVADCVLLFGFGFLEAFPVDVWVAKSMKRLYAAKNERDAREKAALLWGEYAGYAQQYLFQSERSGCLIPKG